MQQYRKRQEVEEVIRVIGVELCTVIRHYLRYYPLSACYKQGLGQVE